MGIKLDIEKRCEDCRFFQAVQHEEYEQDKGTYRLVFKIHCKNEKLCEFLIEEIAKRKRGK